MEVLYVNVGRGRARGIGLGMVPKNVGRGPQFGGGGENHMNTRNMESSNSSRGFRLNPYGTGVDLPGYWYDSTPNNMVHAKNLLNLYKSSLCLPPEETKDKDKDKDKE
jgi:hypothetical protein